MRVAMVAPPWLPIPPSGYGGIENVLAVLVPALMDLGVEVELFTVGETQLQSTKNHYLYKEGQYKFIHKRLYESMPIVIAHSAFAMHAIAQDGGFDLIHCHNGFIGPFGAIHADASLPPLLHTLHGPPFARDDQAEMELPDNTPMWEQLAVGKRWHIVGISQALMSKIPPALKRLALPPVHNGVDPDQFPYVTEKGEYFATLARAHPDKGQAIAVNLCRKNGYQLKLAGLVADMTQPKQVLLQLANPLSAYRNLIDFRYFSDFIFPYLENGQIEYVGDLSGQRKLDFLAGAKALLFPIQWDEPFGMTAIEAMACGTPVVAMARGAMPEIIQHGVNGYLASSELEFERYMKLVAKIDPAACRSSVEKRFSAKIMAKRYLQRYQSVLARTAREKAQ